MTDRIDLDDLDDRNDGETDAGSDDGSGSRGDWFWRGEGRPDDAAEAAEAAEATEGEHRIADTPGTGDGGKDGSTRAGDTGENGGPAIPRVPRENEGKPAGIPVEGGGAGPGAVPGDERTDSPADASPAGETPGPSPDEASGGGGTGRGPEASGPHGGGVDDMTMALTYEACTRLAAPAAAVAEARTWSDWIGIVGDVPAHVINKFQRDHGVDADFFNGTGTGTGPGERLADIDEHSMFSAERMVVVGVPGEEWIAEAAGWEFVPLAAAAGKAGWTVA